MELVCPKCHGVMRQYERAGITIDQCSDCKGIFLDRGELERLVDGESRWHGGRDSPPPYPGQGYPQQGYREGYSQHGHQKKRKRSFLEDLFD